MWLMLQQPEPDDYVIATGQTHSVREFVEEAFNAIGVDIEWTGERLNEKGVDRASGKTLVEVNPEYFRPAEVDILRGDNSKAREKFGWSPKVTFKELVAKMVAHDIECTKGTLRINGYG